MSNHVSHAFSLKLQARDVTVAEWVVLREIVRRAAVSTAPSEARRPSRATRGAISKLADRLIAKALITRTAGREDRRTQSLALTAAGRALEFKLSALADQNDAEFFGHLSACPAQQRSRPP